MIVAEDDKRKEKYSRALRKLARFDYSILEVEDRQGVLLAQFWG